ncbi:4-alpha-glucanotransferase [Paraconexibacter sp. AEG42_29]|uniref:4-alpha-glucanotransferase n=1 Tax=Paraconexibacter sp. AEG42_29 TaxID=2997339 RepID=UPI00339D74E8
MFTRSSGIQLHLTSLPDGRLGPSARTWVDWLSKAGQSWWQVLPVGPPDRHHSPYKSKSAFAAWRGLLADPAAPVSVDELDAFAAGNSAWIDDWARVSGGRRAVADQVRFDREWSALREYAAERGVRIIGDVPIYVAPGSADHLAHPELFRDGLVAGAPPDAYSDDGQLWGNPFYDWPAMRAQEYRWWIARLARTLELFDAARIDHFRGFVAGWAVDDGAKNARDGRWRRGPGRALFDAALAELGSGDAALPFIAEDLGVITPPVERLRRDLGLPGMAVAQFAFDPDPGDSPHELANHKQDVVAYTGTHDSDTLAGWLATLAPERRAVLDAALGAAGLKRDRPVWGVTRLWMGSPSPLVMLQAQDLLELGSEARMNTPGRATGNWGWRLPAGALTAAHARRLRRATEEAGRLPS